MKPSAIGWTDYSSGDLNMVTGCTPVSAGCDHCYGRAIYERFGHDFSQVTTHPDKLARLATARFGKPIKDAAGHTERYSPKRGAPHRPMAFVCDTGDLFHEAVPEEFVARVLQTLCERDDVTWQLLTKRAERMRAYLSEWAYLVHGPLPPHVWLGVSVEDQATANERVPLLLDTPAAVRFVSVEPMLERIDLSPYLGYDTQKEASPDGKRGIPVRPGENRRVGNRCEGQRLGETRESAGAHRASNAAGLPADQEDEERRPAVHRGTSTGLEAFQRADPAGYNHQSQKWRQGRQPIREPGAGYLFREHDTCISHRPQNAVGGQEPSRQVEQRGCGADTRGIRSRPCYSGYIGGAVRRLFPDDLGHSKRDAASLSEGTDQRLYGVAPASKDEAQREGPVHLVICGAESGPNRRLFDPAWAADLYDQCREAGVPFYGKQASGARPGVPLLLDGVTVHEWP